MEMLMQSYFRTNNLISVSFKIPITKTGIQEVQKGSLKKRGIGNFEMKLERMKFESLIT